MTKETRNHLQYLFQQYLTNQISEEEFADFWNILREEARDATSQELFKDDLQWLWEEAKDGRSVIYSKEWDKNMQDLIRATALTNQRKNKLRISSKKMYRWVAVAAGAAILLIGSIYFYPKQQAVPQRIANVKGSQNKGIAPGRNKAVLILSNGSRITLDSVAKGIIAKQGKVSILKSDSGKIAYTPVNSSPAEVVYNTLSIPRGGKYQITLADGTKVWLNAASTLRYPTAFLGDKRIVEMTGEAYFEVAEQETKPFIVKVDGMRVKVLGTHFDIMAYDNEPLIKTTLLEGKVKLAMDDGKSVLLNPGEQAQINKKGEIQPVKKVNVNKAIAWKNNLFWFDESNIHEVMRQVARWYNTEVEIKGNIPLHFTGFIPRDVNILRVFQLLQETGNIHFRVVGKKIIVTS